MMLEIFERKDRNFLIKERLYTTLEVSCYKRFEFGNAFKFHRGELHSYKTPKIRE